jgi:hypothetical protein
MRGPRPYRKPGQRRDRASQKAKLSRDELKRRRRARAETLRAEIAGDGIDNLAGVELLEKFDPMPRGLDQLGDLDLPEHKPPYWVLIG